MNATARAGSNIAFIKYWGVADAALNLPLTNSISMTLDRLYTVTTVNFDDALDADVIVIDGAERRGDARRRAVQQLDRLRGVRAAAARHDGGEAEQGVAVGQGLVD